MTNPATTASEASPPRLFVLDDDKPHDVFDVLGAIDGNGAIVRVRSPFLFEIGEELSIRIEQDGVSSDAIARVRAHIGPNDSRITELEISERTEPRAIEG
ncbi:MAG: hypothetical protein H0V17_18255 [Deltaproteobacteria bacterium]|nr:hypothetical protein [Deltaproteobacteria bacterium]